MVLVDGHAAGAVASANTQSLVEHSPSTVIALNVSRADSLQRALQQRRRHRASVVRKPSIVAMHRLDHAGALGHAADAEGPARRLRR